MAGCGLKNQTIDMAAYLDLGGAADYVIETGAHGSVLNWAVGSDLSYLGELGEAPKIVQEQGLRSKRPPICTAAVLPRPET